MKQVVSPRYLALDQDMPEIGRIRDDLDRDGISQVKGFLQSTAVARLQEEIIRLEARARQIGTNDGQSLKKGYVPDAVDRLAKSDLLLNVVNNVLGSVGGRKSLVRSPVQPGDLRAGVNVMRGPDDVKPLHFDGTYLNIMVPLVIPDIQGDRRGQLTIYPNLRSFAQTPTDRWVIPCADRSVWSGPCSSGARSTTRLVTSTSSTATGPFTG